MATGGGVLITGARGQLGRVTVEAARRRGLHVVGLGHAELPVEDAAVVQQAFATIRPALVLHCAAWTDVDGCERDPARATLVNADGTARVADACVRFGARLVYVSTDFVFDGTARAPYRPEDPPNPISHYGASKLAGERHVLGHARADFHVLRVSWVFGPGGRNFPRAILDRARSGQPLQVVEDEVGSPSFTRDLAEAMLDLAAARAPGGVYHACNEGVISRHRFAEDIVRLAGLRVAVGRMRATELVRPARRPAFSALDCGKLALVRGRTLPNYLDALERYLGEESAGADPR